MKTTKLGMLIAIAALALACGQRSETAATDEQSFSEAAGELANDVAADVSAGADEAAAQAVDEAADEAADAARKDAAALELDLQEGIQTE
jgi:hypothetical protein